MLRSLALIACGLARQAASDGGGEKGKTYELPWLTIPLQSLILLTKRFAGAGQERLDGFR